MGRGTCSIQHQGLQSPPWEHVTLAGGKEFYKTRVCSVHRSVSGRTGLGTRARDKAEEGPFGPSWWQGDRWGAQAPGQRIFLWTG